MMKKYKSLKYIIVLLAVLLIILITILGILYFDTTNNNLRYIYDTDVGGDIEIMPLNVMYSISEYKGSVNQRSIYKALYLLVDKIIPKYYNLLPKINEKGISNYFKKNNIQISKELGITEENDFISFINAIRGLKGDNLKLEQYVFHPDETVSKSGYLQTVLLIKYENNEKIGLYIKISNSKNEDIFAVSCSGGVEESLLEYEYVSDIEVLDEDDTFLFERPGKGLDYE